jgi:Flp pilus assembly protein TadD
MTSRIQVLIVAALVMGASGCRYLDMNEPEESLTVEAKSDNASPTTFGSGPERVWLEKAKENFRSGEYGLAERFYRQAVEERPQNAEAWLGLAASYDHLKRFDEADRAYKVVMKMAGNSPAVLNNLGYHYMLKGDFASAERTLRSAEEKDPSNPYIKNNLVLLENWKANAGRSG